MTNTELCKWLRENSSGIYRPANEAATVIELLEAENEKLKNFIREKCTSDCKGCNYFHYSTASLCYICKHPTYPHFLEDHSGCGCECHTELKILE
jgi:hypothetical protein